MKIPSKAGRLGRFGYLGFLGGLLLLVGCGLDTPDRDEGHEHSHGESDMEVGSARRDGGVLGVDYDFRRVAELGCEQVGALRFCEGDDPGFVPLEANDGDVFFVLPEDVEVTLELVGADPGAQVTVGDVTLKAAGQSVVLGSGEDLHLHPRWQVVPGPVPASTYALSFRLTTEAAGYEDSAVYTLALAPDPAS